MTIELARQDPGARGRPPPRPEWGGQRPTTRPRTGLTACGHRALGEGCQRPDGREAHEPECDGNPFERDGHERCQCCGLPVCGEPTLKDRHASYEDSGQCVPCAMANDDLTINDVATIFNRG